MKTPRVLLIHFHFPPDGLVGTQITAKFAKYLPDHGWDAFVLTASDRYYTRIDPTTLQDVARPDRVYRTRCIPHPRAGYLFLKSVLRPRHGTSASAATGQSAPAFLHARGTPGLRASGAPPSRADPQRLRASHPAAPLAAASPLRKVVRSLVTVPDTLTGWIPMATAAGVRLIGRHRIDCLFSSGPPWTNHLVALLLKRITRRPWLACFEDPWTLIKSTLAPEDVTPVSLAIERRLERAVVRHADAIICLNDHHRAAMIAQFSDCAPEKFVTIPNGYDPAEFAHQARSAPPPNRLVVTHAGTLYYGRTPRELFMAVRRLVDRGLVSPGGLSLHFIGANLLANGQSVEGLARACGVESMVSIRPPVSHPAAVRAMCASHLLLVLAHGWVLQVPAKVYEYLRIGRPILALAPEGATADLIRASGAGAVFDPSDIDGITRHLADQVRRFQYGQRFEVDTTRFSEQFDRRRHTRTLAALLDRLHQHPPATLS